MSKSVRDPNHSHAIYFVLLLLILSSLQTHAQERQNPGRHNQAGVLAEKFNIPFQNDLKKLLDLIRQDRWQEAGPFACQLALRSPTSADANGLYALVLLRGGYPEGATEEAKEALRLDARSYWALVASGRIEMWNGRTAQAKKLFRRAAHVRPLGAEARLGLYLSARTGSIEGVRAVFAYLALAPTGHPHDQAVAYLTSILKGYNPHLSASGKSLEAMSPKVIFGPTAHQISNESLPSDIQKRPLVIPLTCENTGLFVTALINGHPMKLLLDTGADGIALTRQAARRLSLISQGTSTISGVQGSEQSTDYLAKTFQLGPLRWFSIPLQTASFGYGDGVLGVDLLRPYVVCLDLAHHEMRLTSSAEAPLAGTSRQRLQFHEYETKIMFPARVGEQDVWAILDTGATRTMASKRIAETLAASLPATAIQRAINTDQITIGKTATKFSYLNLNHPYDIVLGQKLLRVALVVPDLVGASPVDDQLSPHLDFEIGMLVGISSLLSFQQVIIDYKHQCLLFDTYTKRKGNGSATNAGT